MFTEQDSLSRDLIRTRDPERGLRNGPDWVVGAGWGRSKVVTTIYCRGLGAKARVGHRPQQQG